MEDNSIQGILSFEIESPFVDPFVGDNEPPESDASEGDIRDNLKEVIQAQVNKDGIKKEFILPDELEMDVNTDAVAQIYYDVADFYEWYWNKSDDRFFFLQSQKQSAIPSKILDAVKPVVEDNLDAMREVNEIPAGQDTDGLADRISNALSRYIVNWEDWYYERKKEQDLDAYFEQKSFYDDIYRESDYGALTNLLDSEQYDGVSDVPYYSEDISDLI